MPLWYISPVNGKEIAAPYTGGNGGGREGELSRDGEVTGGATGTVRNVDDVVGYWWCAGAACSSPTIRGPVHAEDIYTGGIRGEAVYQRGKGGQVAGMRWNGWL